MNFKIISKKKDDVFFGKDAESFALLQATSLANYYKGNGRFIVLKNNDSFSVVHDECNTRDGISEEHIFEELQNANSGTMSWDEARFSSL